MILKIAVNNILCIYFDITRAVRIGTNSNLISLQQLEEYDQVRIPRHLLSDQESKDEHESRDLRRKEASAHGESDCRQNPSNF